MTDNIENLLYAPEEETRRNAALLLRDIAPSTDIARAIEMLITLMKDASWRVRKTAVDVLVENYPKEAYLDSLVNLLYDEDNAGARNAAIEAFIRIGPVSVEMLFSAYETEDADVRKFIVDIAGEINHRSMIPLLIRALKDVNENVKAACVEHLGTMREQEAVGALINILDEGDVWTSYPAIDALGRIGDISSMPRLVDALSEKILRGQAIKALGMLGSDDAVRHIVPFINDESRPVMKEAVSALNDLYEHGTQAELIRDELYRAHGEDTFDILLAASSSEHEDLRVPSLVLMGVLGDEKSLDPLLEAASHGLDESLSVRALSHIVRSNPATALSLLDSLEPDSVSTRLLVSAMVKAANPEFGDAFAGMLKSPDGHVRAKSAEGLGAIGDIRAVPLLLPALSEMYQDVKDSVVAALVRLSDGLSFEDIDGLAKNERPEVRRLAVPLLDGLGTEEARDRIGFMLKDSSPLVRKAAADYLAEKNAVDAEALLLHALTDENPEVRSAVAVRIGETRMERFLDPLILLLADPEYMVRVSACKALGLMGSHRALDQLGTLLNDKNGFVVASALEAVSHINTPEAKRMILGMLKSDDREIRRTAIRSLGGFDNVSAHILPFLESEDWSTRYEAAMALADHADEPAVAKVAAKSYTKESDSIVREALLGLMDG